ncbi:acyl-CoA dehydrogenase [Streptomyces sp. NPDC056503]|uniref:acyl-CoA dehydrogenase n=1 Tax=Streptomyces sp. NPDC056503 TaxID=3345842 RepID=UPI0036A2A677
MDGNVWQGIAPLIFRDSREAYRSDLERIFSADVFKETPSLQDSRRLLTTYDRLRYISENLETLGPLVSHRDQLFTVLEWSAMSDPSLFYAMFLHHSMTIGSVVEFGRGRTDLSEELDRLASAETVGALLMTELGHGNSNSTVRTEAVYDSTSGEFVLNTPEPAAVKFPPSVGADGVPRLGVVLAQLKVDGVGHGEFCFLVPLRDASGPCDGVRIGALEPTAMMPLDCAVVSFDHVRIPFRYWLRDNAELTPEGAFSDPLGNPAIRGRRTLSLIRFAWEAAVVGLAATARASAAVAVRHAHRRRTNGRFAADLPVIRYRNQQRTLFGALAGAYVASAVANSVATSEAPPLTAGGVRTTFLMKVATDRIAEQVTTRCRMASGALGFFSKNRFLDYQGFAHSLNAAAADNQILLLDAAYAMAAGLDYTPPTEEAPAPSGRDLLEPETWTALARARESALHQELLDGLKKAKENGLSEFDAWNGQFDVAERFAAAHAGRLVLDTLRTALDKVSEPDSATALRTLCALYALEEIASHDGWYLAGELLSKEEVRRIPTLLDELCERLEPNALELAEALRVPYDVIGAPIAGDDYVADIARPVTTD